MASMRVAHEWSHNWGTGMVLYLFLAKDLMSLVSNNFGFLVCRRACFCVRVRFSDAVHISFEGCKSGMG